MTEFGVFTGEGCIERGFTSREQAETDAMRFRLAGQADAYADEMCPEHEEQPRHTCEECTG